MAAAVRPAQAARAAVPAAEVQQVVEDGLVVRSTDQPTPQTVSAEIQALTGRLKTPRLPWTARQDKSDDAAD
jgi:hypothetical protein